MGYRSEVALALKKEDYEDLKNLARKDNRADVLNFLKSGEIDQLPCPNEARIILHWSWTKWYGDEVYFIEKFLKDLECENEDDNCAYELVNIGEDLSDSEQYGEEKYIWLNRSIGYPGGNTDV